MATIPFPGGGQIHMLDAVSTALETKRCAFREIPDHLSAAGVLGKQGDVKIIWDANKPDDVAAAKLVFDELRSKNYLAFKVKGDNGDKDDEQIHEFDPNARRMILTPQMQAG